MSEEIRTENEKKCECLCQNKEFRKFLVIAAGSFVGVFCALSLFAALHKPPMMPMHRMPNAEMARPCRCGCHHGFDRGHRGEFHRKMVKPPMEQKSPDLTQTETER